MIRRNLMWPGILILFLIPAASGQSNLHGVIDIHLHVSPDSEPHPMDAIDLAKLAKSRGMRGLVLKSNVESTAGLAYVVRKEVPGIEVFGGIVLNRSVGGINPAAVEGMVQMTGGWGKVVWMPTLDSENQIRHDKQNLPFVSVSKNGRLLPSVIEVIDLCAKHDLTIETGHSSAAEGLMLVRAAHERGVRHIVVTHAMAGAVHMTIPQMKEAANEGAFIEFTYAAIIVPHPIVSMSDYAQAIRALGPEHCILVSDMSLPELPVSPDSLTSFFAALRKEGIVQSDIDLMSKTNPAVALNLLSPSN
jgi:hypothetical protein